MPHLAARSVAGDAHLAEIVGRLTTSGVDDVFVLGGDAARPARPFDGALPLPQPPGQVAMCVQIITVSQEQAV